MDLSLIHISRQRLENILAQTDEIQYANDQCNQWQEIRDYMTLLIRDVYKRQVLPPITACRIDILSA